MKLALQGAGVSTGHVRNMKGIATGLAMITVSENDNTIVVVPGANGRVDRACVDSINKELEKYDMVVLQHEIPQETVCRVPTAEEAERELAEKASLFIVYRKNWCV